jgi:O-antigen/teichoic acid export membrane protein
MSEGENRDILETVAKGAGITAFGMFASKFLAYLYRTAVARMVGPESYGQISIGLMVAGIGITLSSLSLDSAILNYLPKYRHNENEEKVRGIVKSAFMLALPASVLLSASIFLSSEFIATAIFESAELTSIIRIFSLAIPFGVVTKISLDVTKAYKTAKYYVWIRQIGQNIIQLVAAVGLILLGYKVSGAAGGWLIGAVGGGIISLYIMEKKFGPLLFSTKGDTREYRKIFRYSYPLILAGAIGSILGWTDTFFLGYYMQETQVGLYNAALPTAMLMLIPYQALAALVMPSMSEVIERDDKDLTKLLKTLTRWTFTLSFPAFCLMFLFSDQVLHILFGAEYTKAATSLTILAFGYLYSTSVGHLDSVIKAIEKTKILYKNAAINFVVNIGLNILLIPQYGIMGAAIATSASIIFANTLLLAEVYYFRKTQPFSFDSIKPVIAALSALLLTYLGLNHFFKTVPLWVLVPGVLIFGLLYLSVLYTVNGIQEDELSILRDYMNSLRKYFRT